jgi:hypothetical protein
MDLATLQAVATIVGQIGLPASLGLGFLIIVWNLTPVLRAYLMSKIVVNKAAAQVIAATGSTPSPITHIPS